MYLFYSVIYVCTKNKLKLQLSINYYSYAFNNLNKTILSIKKHCVSLFINFSLVPIFQNTISSILE